MGPAVDPTPSDTFGPYELYERLGLGGMASVHRAKKRGIEGFERIVALKRMLSHLAEDATFVDSFIREAKVASLLHHPNIAQIYDFGRIGGVYYIAMELVTGFDLRKLLRFANRSNESIPLPIVLSILAELCEALDYAHSFVDDRGRAMHIVHRDISPSNLIVANTGHLKVIDFGIAKAATRQLHTESGQVKGKLGYMSPEAALGMNLGPVADIFSLGVVAWELITASPLFSARTDYETMRRIREADVAPPSKHNPSCPPALDAIVLSALERDPDHRLASAGAFRSALDSIAARAGVQVSARSVADWIVQFLQPGDGWIPGSSARLPLPPEAPTSIIRSSRAARLKRTTEDIKLAAEIWGEDAATAASGSPGPDFNQTNVLTPPPMHGPPPPLGRKPSPLPARIVAKGSPLPASLASNPSPIPASLASHRAPQPQAVAQTPLPPPRLSEPTPDLRRRMTPITIVVLLAMIAAVLGAIAIWQRTSDATETPVVATATVRFVVQPAGAIIVIAGEEVGRTSPLETELATGTYAVTVRQDGFTPWTDTLTVRKGERQTVNVALDRAAVAATTITTTMATDPRTAPAIKASPITPRSTRKPSATLGTSPPPRDSKSTAVKPHESESPAPSALRPPPEVTTPPPVASPVIKPPDPPPAIVAPPPNAGPPAPLAKPSIPVVGARAVRKLSGETPVLKGSGTETSGDVLVKMCIEEQGHVTSVRIIKSTGDIAGDLKQALETWRYKPYLDPSGKPAAVCFPLSLRIVLERAN